MSSRLLPLLSLVCLIPALSLTGACAISDEPAISDDDGGFEGGGGMELGDAQSDPPPEDAGGDAGGGADPPGPDGDGIKRLPCGDANGEPTFRFTTLKIKEPSELSGLLGALMSADIDKGVLNILVELKGLTAGGDTFDLLGGGGALCEGAEAAYTWDTETPNARPSDPFDATLAADGSFEVGSDAAVLYFPITLLDASVRLDRLRVAGTLSAGHDAISAGRLSGYILRSTAEAISIAEALSLPEGTMLSDALPQQDGSISDCDGQECWFLRAEYDAILTTAHAAP